MQKTKSLPSHITKDYVQGLALILGVLIMSFLVGYLVLAWTEPGATPPDGNVPAPINIGSTQQWKEGGLGIGTKTFDLGTGQVAASIFYDRDNSSWYVNPAGTSVFSGSVGIGTTVPSEKVHVQGGHSTSKIRIFSDEYGQGVGGGNTADLVLWASEPGWTWTGVGIGNNMIGSPYYGRRATNRGASYIRLLDNQILLNTLDSAGTDRNGLAVSNGNVGIGTTNPGAYKLNVSGDANATRLCIAGTCKDSWPSVSESDTLQTVTNRGNVAYTDILFDVPGDAYIWFRDGSGVQVYNPEGTGNEVRLGAAWNKPGVYSNGSLYLGSESQVIINDNNQENWGFDGDNFWSNGWGHIYTTASNLHLDSYSGEMYLNYYYNNWVNVGNRDTGYLFIGNTQLYDDNDWFRIYSGANNRIYTNSYLRIDNGLELNGRIYANEWIQFNNYSGLYSPLNGAHFYPNNASYGSWRVAGSRNGWYGLEFDTAAGQTTFMMGTTGQGWGSQMTGVHNNSYGWLWRWDHGTLAVGTVPWGNISKPGNLTYWNTWYGSSYLGSNGDLYMGWAGNWLSTVLSGKVTSPACTLCLSCGGEWPSFQGSFSTDDDSAKNNEVGRGYNCSGSLQQNTQVARPISLCCR